MNPSEDTLFPQPHPMRPKRELSNSIGIKLATIALLTLCFLVPLFMLDGLTRDRENRQESAINEVGAAWAPELELATPVILVPYDYRTTDDSGKYREYVRYCVINPENLVMTANLVPTIRTVGIFRIPLFTIGVQLNADFQGPLLSDLGSDALRIDWRRAALVQTLPSWSSLARPADLVIGETTLAMDQPRADLRLGEPAAVASLERWAGEKIAISLTLDLKGSKAFSVVSHARQTTVDLTSTWKSPGFFGTALPDERLISDAGMSAHWQLMRYAGSRFRIVDSAGEGAIYLNSRSGLDPGHGGGIVHSGFGFRLYQPGTVYQMTDRALKYGILFVVMPFLGLFLFENLRRRRLHVLQYILVGLTNTVFYLLLLSISEHLSFDIAYGLAASVVTGLVSWYAGRILARWSDGYAMAGILGSLYLYLYFALRSEDYALLIGSIGLFVLVATTMIVTRKIDWYTMGKPKDTPKID